MKIICWVGLHPAEKIALDIFTVEEIFSLIIFLIFLDMYLFSVQVEVYESFVTQVIPSFCWFSVYATTKRWW